MVHADGVIMVTCPNLPGFARMGDDEVEALANAVDGIETTLQAYMQDRRPTPAPSVRWRGYRVVRLPALAVAKLGLWEAMQDQGLRKADLARALDVHMPQVDRLLIFATAPDWSRSRPHWRASGGVSN
jgi:antitoxin HicB